MTNKTMIAKAVKFALYSGFAASMAVGAPASFAADEDDGAEEAERIVVTGSRIKRTDIEGVSPVQSYSKEDLDISGHNTIQDFVRTLTTSNGNTGDDNNNSFANGTSTLNLRGLGNNATLVLVNGRRLASYGQAQNITEQFVDLNSIPMSAVERIDILKDGASAIYGADAVAGVVNFILRKDYEGAEVTLGYQTDVDRDTPQQSVSVTFGAGNDKTHFTSIFSYLKREPLFYRDREFSEDANHEDRGGVNQRSSFGYPGTIFDGATFTPGPGCDPDAVVGGICRFNYNDFINFYPESERVSSTNFINHQLSDDANLFVDFTVNRNHSVNIAAPAPWVGPYNGFGGSTSDLVPAADQGLLLGGLAVYFPTSNPNNTFGQNVGLLHRPVSFGPRTGEITSNTYRIITGVEGFLTDTWDYDVAVGYSRSDVLVENRNSINATALQQLLIGTPDPAGSGDMLYYDPFSTTQDQRVIDYAKVTFENRNNSYEKSLTANFTGPLFEMGGGEAGLAVGAEYREQTSIAQADPLRNFGGLVGTGRASDTRGYRDQTSLYAEMALPFTDNFEVQIAGRYEDYSDFGTTTKPKVGFKWDITDDLLFRASYGESFRAPSLVELFSGNVTSFIGGVNDPNRCPNGDINDPANVPDVTAADCGGGQFQVDNAGNPDLQPEESESYNAGIVWAPDSIEGLNIGFDYFSFEHENIITQLPLASILALDSADQVIRVNPSDRQSQIVSINQSYNNGSSQTVTGWDFDINYQWDALGGIMRVGNESTYYEEFEFQPLVIDENGDQQLGEVIEGTGNKQLGSFPQLRSNTQFSYATGDHAVTATGRYRSGIWATNNQTWRRTASLTTWDLAYTYDSDFGRWQLGCINCTDREPIFDPSGSEEAGYFKSLDDPRGTVVYVRWTQQF